MKTKKGLWRRIWQLLVVCMLLAAALFCVLEGIVIAGSGSSKNQDADVVVVLGAMVYQRGPSPVLVQRMDTALSYLETHPDTVVVASGGQGEDERESEARAIAGYLTEKGVAQDRILLEEQSVNTYQNLSNSAALLEEKGYDLDATRILVVSNGFHLVRVRMPSDRHPVCTHARWLEKHRLLLQPGDLGAGQVLFYGSGFPGGHGFGLCMAGLKKHVKEETVCSINSDNWINITVCCRPNSTRRRPTTTPNWWRS